MSEFDVKLDELRQLAESLGDPSGIVVLSTFQASRKLGQEKEFSNHCASFAKDKLQQIEDHKNQQKFREN
jgi:hypothetical protein